MAVILALASVAGLYIVWTMMGAIAMGLFFGGRGRGRDDTDDTGGMFSFGGGGRAGRSPGRGYLRGSQRWGRTSGGTGRARPGGQWGRTKSQGGRGRQR